MSGIGGLACHCVENVGFPWQHSFFCRLTEDKKSERFFKVFYDRMKVAQQEIKATVTVNTSDLGNKKKDDEIDRDAPSRKKGKRPPVPSAGPRSWRSPLLSFSSFITSRLQAVCGLADAERGSAEDTALPT